MMNWMGGTGWMGFGGIPMFLVLILLIVAVVAVVAFVRSQAGDSGRRSDVSRGTPLEILQERYARGDIGRDEYEQKRRDLTQ